MFGAFENASRVRVLKDWYKLGIPTGDISSVLKRWIDYVHSGNVCLTLSSSFRSAFVDLSKEPLTADFVQLEENFGSATKIIPALKDASVEKTYARVLCMAPDGLPLLGPLEGSINYWVAGGFS